MSKDKKPAKILKEFDFSKFNNNFYAVNKKEMLRYRPLFQRLSSGFINFEKIKDEKDYEEKAVRFLARTAYGLFSFLTKEKDPNINLDSKSEANYCGLDTNIIAIGLKLLKLDSKVICRQHKIDMLSALIFHEFYHKRYTVSAIKKELGLSVYEKYYNTEKTKKYLDKILPDELHKTINNILEDRRIETLGAEDFQGNTFYFDELRKYAYFLHFDKVFSPPFSEAIILDYLLMKILLPELEEHFFKESLARYEEGLEQLKVTTAIGKEGYEMAKVDFESVKKIVLTIKTYIEANESLIFTRKWSDVIEQTKKIIELIPEKTQQSINEKMKKNKKTYVNVVFGLGGDGKNAPKSEDFIDSGEQLLEIISDELKKMDERVSDVKGTNVQKIKIEKIYSKDANSLYPYAHIIEEPFRKIDQKLYSDAKRMAKSIFNNLGFLDSKFSRFIENFEMNEGDLDETELFSLSFNNKDIFEDIEEIPDYALDFGILLDESGSMHENIEEAKKAVLALILALKDHKKIKLFVYGHTANGSGVPKDAIQLYKYYNTLDNFVDWRRIFTAKSRSNNADGYAIQKVADIMKESKTREKILVVVSDGQPSASGYGGNTGERHVKQVTTTLERQGILVTQVCMDNIEASPRMFNHYIPYDKKGMFFDNLKKILLTKLNQFSESI